MNRNLVWAAAGLCLVAACKSHTDVQGGYVNQRDDCRELAVLKQDIYTEDQAGLGQKDRNAQLLTLFGHCMYERGWTVAAPVQQAKPPSEPLPGSELQVPLDGQQGAVILQEVPPGAQQIQTAPSDAPQAIGNPSTATGDATVSTPPDGTYRKIPTENGAVLVPSSNVPIQTPFSSTPTKPVDGEEDEGTPALRLYPGQ